MCCVFSHSWTGVLEGKLDLYVTPDFTSLMNCPVLRYFRTAQCAWLLAFRGLLL